MPHFYLAVLFSLALLLAACTPDLPADVQQAYAALPERVDFNQHIRPILSDRCWSCHGPDAAARQANLRLDTEQGAFGALHAGAGFAFKPGSVGKSDAIRRLLSDDPEVVMPTPESKMTVSPREIALIIKWVEQGAEWKDHWAFLPIADPAVPGNPGGFAAANEIDHFVNARLSQNNLAPAGRAPHERLLRRLYLDLTGLPPSPEQLDAWLANPSDAHYARIADELLASEAHAERLATEWLDLARYADSHGLHADGYRTSWPYRDWVINALHVNMPFDEFVRMQVAGDLYLEANTQTRIASAFNRMHPMTAEGGVIGEEMRLSYVFDRVNTVATGILGLTMDCSRCHDHKFDPISQSEYYGFSAFFNNFNELGMIGDDGDFGPYMLLPSPETQRTLSEYDFRINELDAERAAVAIDAAGLEAFLQRSGTTAPAPDDHLPLDKAVRSSDGRRIDRFAWSTADLEIVNDQERGPVAAFDHPYDDIFLDQGHGHYGATDAFSASIWLKTTKRDSSKEQSIMGTTGDKNQAWRGHDLYLDSENRLNFRLIRVWPDDALHVRTTDSLTTDTWHQVGFTYDGTGMAKGIRLYVNGEMPDQHVMVDKLLGDTYPGNAAQRAQGVGRKLRLGQAYRAFTGENGIFKGYLDDLRLWDRALTVTEMLRVVKPAAKPDRNAASQHLLASHPDYARATATLRTVKQEQLAMQDTLLRLMVSEEMEQPRRTFRLDRGAYDAPQEEVFPTTPGEILPFPEHFPANRLGLVEWMFLPENPLTARVAVNRYWQLIFGQGIVSTPHDFGSQGALPSHPELLDYLATRFRNSSWDIRVLLRDMVLSEAYRRDSRARPEQRELDPGNQLLARGPSGRLPAEMIRDNALAAAGLLVRKTGGPSVRPYQPDGLWIQANNFSQALLRYRPDSGEKLYRRSMYTFIKRTAPPPFMTNFDASGRDVCAVTRSTTNTPLQALNLLNDPQFVEAARVLAQRVQGEVAAPDEQLARAFRLVAGRTARQEEVAVLQSLYAEELSRFTADPAAADSLLSVGEYPFPESLDRTRTAALASVGNMLLSFDEAYVKR